MPYRIGADAVAALGQRARRTTECQQWLIRKSSRSPVRRSWAMLRSSVPLMVVTLGETPTQRVGMVDTSTTRFAKSRSSWMLHDEQ